MQTILTLPEFNHLSNSEKYSILEDHGIYLDVYRFHGSYKIALFELSGYYVQVWLNEATDKLNKAVAFNEYEKLDPFLKTIDLGGIYSML